MDAVQFSQYLKDARKYQKTARSDEKYDIKIAVLGSCSTQYFVMLLRYYLHCENVEAEIYEGEYGSITSDILDDRSSLYRFQPDVLIVIPDFRDIRQYPPLMADSKTIGTVYRKVLRYYRDLWGKLEKLQNCFLLQGNFVLPVLSELGNLEANYPFSKRRFLSMINHGFAQECPANGRIVDLEFLSSLIGKRNWFDDSQFFLTKMPCRLEYLYDMTVLFANQVLALKGSIRKCIVLDLDDTLWGGVAAEEGFDGINLDPNHAVGESFLSFQAYLLGLKRRGVLLAVCSKNDEHVAKEPFLKNKNMRIKLDDIACFVANWDDKATNIKRIAGQLNIGLDSLVFFDDNPAEREIVKRYLPMVKVIDVPRDSAGYASALEEAAAFEWLQLTKEDADRSASYIADKKRTSLEGEFVDYGAYLKALDMKADIGLITKQQIGRFSQLINKSNQFNLRTQRYSEAAIERYMRDETARCIFAELEDRFSDYGLISCVILKKFGDSCFINTWVMSCRVLKRGLENAMFRRILQAAKELECSQVIGEYIPTAKNTMVKGLLTELGFESLDHDQGIPDISAEGMVFRYPLDKEFEREVLIGLKPTRKQL